MHKTNLARSLAWTLAALSLMLTLAGLAAAWRAGEKWLDTHLLFGPVTAITYALVGALIAARQPRNRIGWIFSAEGVFVGLTTFSSYYQRLGLWSTGPLPGIEIARWLSLWIWMPGTILPLTFLLLLFPDDRLPSPRWRPVAWSAGLGLALYVVSTALHPRPPIEPNPPVNPFGIPEAAEALELLAYPALPLLMFSVFGSLAALVVRFRRSRGTEREQLKWLTYGG